MSIKQFHSALVNDLRHDAVMQAVQQLHDSEDALAVFEAGDDTTDASWSPWG